MSKTSDLDYDICIVGSGAGASPVAYTLAKAGANVLVLEKGPWLKIGRASCRERV